jgi:hypothetical protein
LYQLLIGFLQLRLFDISLLVRLLKGTLQSPLFRLLFLPPFVLLSFQSPIIPLMLRLVCLLFSLKVLLLPSENLRLKLRYPLFFGQRRSLGLELLLNLGLNKRSRYKT